MAAVTYVFSPNTVIKSAYVNQNFTDCLAAVTIAGEVRMYGGTSAPTDWLLCNGTVYNIVTYPTLGALLGSAFGGNGTTTFGVPDFRDRFPMGASGTKARGSYAGSATANIAHTHTGPNHTHTGPSHTHTGPEHRHDGSSLFARIGLRSGDNSQLGMALAGTTVNENREVLTVSYASAGTTTPWKRTGVSGYTEYDGTGATGAGGTGATGAGGTGATGAVSANNPSVLNPYQAINFIIKT